MAGAESTHGRGRDYERGSEAYLPDEEEAARIR